ncbi:SRPBCC family protein [Solicola gregarius]|uniref:SRPBCC domain-containing protein n=1 Tax=Solicola gregarius TaxID=2908642 RepID=A0AA46TG51_9ACTN|nr:SRPBCC domain-containing protein [Solicola gregarius]UYM04520.1 SRPBCC domain-containing protein [Solicola gregarius]
MQKGSYTTEYTVDVPVDDVVRAIADVRGYWSPSTTGDSEHEGDEFVYRDSALMSHFRVGEVVPGQRVVWDVLESRTTFVDDPAEWDGTRVVFELAPDGDGTRLRFTHEGLSEAKECFNACSRGWDGVINDSLKHLITTGRSMFDE